MPALFWVAWARPG